MNFLKPWRQKAYIWLEEYLFFSSSFVGKMLSFCLLPFALMYGILGLLRRLGAVPKHQNIPIISVGNLILGGSGKTPTGIAIAKALGRPLGIVLRGYKRQSKDAIVVVSHFGDLKTSLQEAGDEAMLFATLHNAIVVVAPDRQKAIEYLKTQAIDYVLLDDGFSKVHIDKFDLLLEPSNVQDLNARVLPSGCLREFGFVKRFAHCVAKEGIDFKRCTRIPRFDPKSTLLVTSISRPKRLGLDGVQALHFPDHHAFCDADLQSIQAHHPHIKTLLMTTKDAVKLKPLLVNYDWTCLVMELEIVLSDELVETLECYILNYRKR